MPSRVLIVGQKPTLRGVFGCVISHEPFDLVQRRGLPWPGLWSALRTRWLHEARQVIRIFVL